MLTSLHRGKFLAFLSRELGHILSTLVDTGVCSIFGFAGHVSIEIAGSNLSEKGELCVESLEDFLLKYQDGAKPELLPRCPVAFSEL